MNVRLEFEGNGWLSLTLTHGGESATLVGAYLRDTPRELLEALVRLLHDAREESVRFAAEPNQWVLRMRQLPGRLLRIEVHYQELDVDGPPAPPGEPLFRHTEPAERFAARIHDEFERWEAQGLEEDYGYFWGLDPFPRRALDSLRHVLRERDAIPG